MRLARGSPWRPDRECRVDQRRGVGAAADVGVADGRRLAVRAGERDLPGTERPIGVRDLRLRLLAGEPAEFRAADVDAGQDPAVVLLAPCVQAADADAEGEQEAQDERDAEAGGERPSAPRPCRGLDVGHGGREGQDRHGIDASSEVGDVSAVAMSVVLVHRRRDAALDERRELGVGRRASRRRVWLRSWAGRSSDAHARWAGAGTRPRQPRHLRVCARICHATVGSAGQDWDAGRPPDVSRRTVSFRATRSRPRR